MQLSNEWNFCFLVVPSYKREIISTRKKLHLRPHSSKFNLSRSLFFRKKMGIEYLIKHQRGYYLFQSLMSSKKLLIVIR